MAEATQDIQLSDANKSRLQALWKEAAEPIAVPPEESTAQALALGVNFRIHLGKALIAAWETSKVAVKATAMVHAPFTWFGWLEVGAEVVGAVAALFGSLVQKMRPIDYVTCVVLSNHPDGLTEGDLEKAVEDFLNEPKRAADLAWYFGMSENRVRRAREVLAARDWFSDVLKNLRTIDFLREEQGKLKFKSRHYNVGWKPE